MGPGRWKVGWDVKGPAILLLASHSSTKLGPGWPGGLRVLQERERCGSSREASWLSSWLHMPMSEVRSAP